VQASVIWLRFVKHIHKFLQSCYSNSWLMQTETGCSDQIMEAISCDRQPHYWSKIFTCLHHLHVNINWVFVLHNVSLWQAHHCRGIYISYLSCTPSIAPSVPLSVCVSHVIPFHIRMLRHYSWVCSHSDDSLIDRQNTMEIAFTHIYNTQKTGKWKGDDITETCVRTKSCNHWMEQYFMLNMIIQSKRSTG
jgi:hypothetical protein